MNEYYGQTDRALSSAAELVNVARSDVKTQCDALSGHVQQMMTGWSGRGATAMSRLMIAWQERQGAVLRALDDLSTALVETERDNVTTDEAEAAATAHLQARLGM